MTKDRSEKKETNKIFIIFGEKKLLIKSVSIWVNLFRIIHKTRFLKCIIIWQKLKYLLFITFSHQFFWIFCLFFWNFLGSATLPLYLDVKSHVAFHVEFFSVEFWPPLFTTFLPFFTTNLPVFTNFYQFLPFFTPRG